MGMEEGGVTGAWGEELKGGGGRGRTGILTSRGRGGTRKEVELKISCLVWCLTLAVFTFKISLSKLHYLPITSNLLPHVWSIKYR